MNKNERANIKSLFGGRCAYCGCELGGRFHVDHVHARYRGGADETENYFPACQRCNLWKKTFTVEEFRAEIAAQAERLMRQSAGLRLAYDYGVVVVTADPVVFYFERHPA